MAIKIVMKKVFIFLLFTLSGFFVSGQLPINNQISELYDIMTRHSADYGSLSRYYLMKHSPESLDRMKRFSESYLTELETYDFDNLSQSGKIDYILFKRDLNHQLSEISHEQEIYSNVQTWLHPGILIH